MSLIPDELKSTVSDLGALYTQVEATKAQISLLRAQSSLANLTAATAYQNAQAKASTATDIPGIGPVKLSGRMMLGLLVVGGIALYMAVR